MQASRMAARRRRWWLYVLRCAFWLVVLSAAWNAVGWAIGRPSWFTVLSIPMGVVFGLAAWALASLPRRDRSDRTGDYRQKENDRG